MIKPNPVVWLMGPTSAGKTTLARALSERLRARGGVPII
ncbi:MAG TPA: adenylyl-sulfate kinase, partial [Rhodospirillales bacterium]|nr:adenylyl-sulfate kinase [Rhodospirillales bacterium]